MLNLQTTQTEFAEISRGDARTRQMATTPNRNRIIKKMDATITDRVNEALWNDDVLRNTDYKAIDVYVEDQIVYLNGHVVSTTNQQRVEHAIRAIPGIVEVISTLLSDDNLTREVAGALGSVEHIHKVKFFTVVRHGVVVLNGEVSDVNVRFLAEKCAGNIPGVRGVINHIRTPGVTQNTDDLRFLQPTIGEQIYFRDGPSGIVIQVILNPINRLVIAMIVHGRFSKSQASYSFGSDREDSTSKNLVIPMREIRYLTKRSGFLHIKTVETERYWDFEPTDFIPPKKDWKPPFPYYLEEVLFPSEYWETIHQTEEEAFPEPLEVAFEDSLSTEQSAPMDGKSIREYAQT